MIEYYLKYIKENKVSRRTTTIDILEEEFLNIYFCTETTMN